MCFTVYAVIVYLGGGSRPRRTPLHPPDPPTGVPRRRSCNCGRRACRLSPPRRHAHRLSLRRRQGPKKGGPRRLPGPRLPVRAPGLFFPASVARRPAQAGHRRGAPAAEREHAVPLRTSARPPHPPRSYVTGRVRAPGEINGKSANVNNCLQNVVFPVRGCLGRLPHLGVGGWVGEVAGPSICHACLRSPQPLLATVDSPPGDARQPRRHPLGGAACSQHTRIPQSHTTPHRRRTTAPTPSPGQSWSSCLTQTCRPSATFS